VIAFRRQSFCVKIVYKLVSFVHTPSAVDSTRRSRASFRSSQVNECAVEMSLGFFGSFHDSSMHVESDKHARILC
jgi:hypothetical protein